MTTSVDPDFIAGILVAGSYPDGTLNEFNILTFEQPQNRRRYPSLEIIYVPEGQTQNRKQTDKTLGFEIRYYDKIVGGRAEQIDVLKQVEDEISTILEVLVLEDPNVLMQTFAWERRHIQKDGTHPEYNVSILKISIRSRMEAGQINDAVLTFIKNGSNVVTPPSGNSTYSQIFDTEFHEGYRTHEEQVTNNTQGKGVPFRYRGGFQSTFVTHIHVLVSDIGSTGDKANNLNVLLSSGEKPEFNFQWKKNTDDTPTQHIITQGALIEVDRVEYAYTYDDIVVFRVFGHAQAPSSLSVT